MDGEEATVGAHETPRRAVYNPFGGENAEAGPSRLRRSTASRSPRYYYPPPANDEGDEEAGDEEREPPDSDGGGDASGDRYASDASGASGSSDSGHSAYLHDEAPPSSSSSPEPEEGAPPPPKPPPKRKRKSKAKNPQVRKPRRIIWQDVAGEPGFEWYEGEYRQHVAETERRQRGVARLNATQMGWEASLATPTMSLWTPEDKGRFFAALVRHSRLRPDLIAADMETKNELEVLQYIDLMESAMEGRHDRAGYHDERPEWRDRRLGDGAYEVPPGFVEEEERVAALLALVHRPQSEVIKKEGFRRVPGRPSRPMTRETRAEVEEWGQDFTDSKMAIASDMFLVTAAKDTPRLPNGKEATGPEEDEEMIALLSDIPPEERSTTQRQTLRTLLNRRFMRQRYRRKRLHAQGWTDDNIDAQGGPDAVFVAVKPGGGGPRKTLAKYVMEDNPELPRMRKLGLESYLENRGWEIFNFARMAQFIELYQSAYGAPSTKAPGTSFAVLFDVYKLFWHYVRGMMLHTYIIAKAGNPRVTEIEKWHVESFFEAYGISDPHQQLKDQIKKFQHVSQIARDREAGARGAAERPDGADGEEDEGQDVGNATQGEDEGASGRRYPDALRDGLERAATVQEYAPVGAVGPAPPHVAEAPPDFDLWLPFRTQTDDEDSELEERLDEADSALDAVMARQLRGATKASSFLRISDQAWLDRRSDRGRHWLDFRTAVSVPFDERAALLRAQNVYRETATKITFDRRRRRVIADRTTRYPRHQAEVAASRNRRHPPVPMSVLAAEWANDDETHDRRVDLPRRTDKTPRKRRRGEGSDSEGEARPRKRKARPEEAPPPRSGSVSGDSDEWEASGDSSAAMTTSDEDEPREPIVVSDDEGGGDDPMAEDEPMAEDDPMAADDPMEMDDGDVGEAGGVDEPLEDPNDGFDSGDEAGDEDDEAPANRSAEVIGGDDALDSDDEAPGNQSAEAIGGDDALDSDDEPGAWADDKASNGAADDRASDGVADDKAPDGEADAKSDASDREVHNESAASGREVDHKSDGNAADDKADASDHEADDKFDEFDVLADDKSDDRKSDDWGAEPADTSAGLVGGDDVLDANDEPAYELPLPDLPDLSGQALPSDDNDLDFGSGDDHARDAGDDGNAHKRHSSPLPNGHASSPLPSERSERSGHSEHPGHSVHSQHAHHSPLANGSASPHKPSSPYHSESPPLTAKQAWAESDGDDKHDDDKHDDGDAIDDDKLDGDGKLDDDNQHDDDGAIDDNVIAVAAQLSQHLPDEDGDDSSEDDYDEKSEGDVPATGWPVKDEGHDDAGLLGGDDALDSDSD